MLQMPLLTKGLLYKSKYEFECCFIEMLKKIQNVQILISVTVFNKSVMAYKFCQNR